MNAWNGCVGNVKHVLAKMRRIIEYIRGVNGMGNVACSVFFVPKAFFNLAIKPAILELEANGLFYRRRKTAGVANTYFAIPARSFAPKNLPVSDLSLSRS